MLHVSITGSYTKKAIRDSFLYSHNNKNHIIYINYKCFLYIEQSLSCELIKPVACK